LVDFHHSFDCNCLRRKGQTSVKSQYDNGSVLAVELLRLNFIDDTCLIILPIYTNQGDSKLVSLARNMYTINPITCCELGYCQWQNCHARQIWINKLANKVKLALSRRNLPYKSAYQQNSLIRQDTNNGLAS
jgi:hypothetical protein